MTKLTSPKAKFNPQYTNKRTKKCTAKRNIVVDNFLHIRVNNIIQSFYLLFFEIRFQEQVPEHLDILCII